MMNKLTGWEDTIVALATPNGIGAIGVIRLSGPRAIEIINGLFLSKDLHKQASHTLHVGMLQDGGQLLDEVVVSLFKNPRSYTGEDVVEISCHGSPFIQQKIMEACIQHGARMARAGEFTQRAFLNGKLDLTQAEAVADLIASNTQASQRTALYNIKGGFSEVLKALREELITFSALIELELDFSEEDVEFANREKFYALIQTAQSTTRHLLESFQLGNVIKNGVSVAIIGKPNAGKSTLLNCLLNENRAIVSEIAGTTRDTIEETLNINGVIFRLIDTAGIHDNSTDTIEQIGIEKSLEKMKSADLVLYIFDANDMKEDELRLACTNFDSLRINYLLVANKTDLQPLGFYQKAFKFFQHTLFISAKNKAGINTLKDQLYKQTVHELPATENVIITNARHVDALKKVYASLQEIKNGLDHKLTGDLLTPDIKQCLLYISEITGDISNEHILDYIFSKFCIGK